MGQKYLASGVHVAMRLWENEPPGERKQPSRREYETVGFVLAERSSAGATAQLHGASALDEGGYRRVAPGNETGPLGDLSQQLLLRSDREVRLQDQRRVDRIVGEVQVELTDAVVLLPDQVDLGAVRAHEPGQPEPQSV